MSNKKRKSNIFNELNELHKKATIVVDDLEEVVAIYRSPIVAQSVVLANKEETDGIVNAIAGDIATYRKQLDDLKATHSKWGAKAPMDSDRFTECHDLGHKYIEIISTMSSATAPMTIEVYQAISRGLEK